VDSTTEQERLESLRSYHAFSEERSAHLDAIARLAAQITGLPTVEVNLVGESMVVTKGAFGSARALTPRAESLCDVVIRRGAELVADDAAEHPATAGHHVVDALGLRTYAGVPLVGRDGTPVGVLCVYGCDPHHFTPDELAALRALADQVVTYLELRRLDGAPDTRAAGQDPAVTQQIRLAVTSGELVNHYQPIVDLVSGRVVAIEALVRWQHPAQGLLGPQHFLPAIERTSLIRNVGRCVLDNALADAAGLRDGHDALEQIAVHVNVSPRELATPGFSSEVLHALDQHELPGDALLLEITETVELSDESTALRHLRVLRAHGVGLALDDYGAGYSSLLRVLELPITVLKMDRRVTAAVASDPRTQAATRSTLEMCGRLEITTVAEGIETIDQMTTLVELGCDQGQGFLLGRPMPATVLPRLRRHGDDPGGGVPAPRPQPAVELLDRAGPRPPERQHPAAIPPAPDVARQLFTAWARGASILLVADPERTAQLEAELRDHGLPLESARARGQYLAADEPSFLALVCDEAMSRETFVRTLATTLSPLGPHPVTVYTTTPATLAGTGRADAAVTLASWWSGVGEQPHLSVLCEPPGVPAPTPERPDDVAAVPAGPAVPRPAAGRPGADPP
jgi:EAL domain-containing protein (putative c-di-GMP-specific phosphodiesterase class I)